MCDDWRLNLDGDMSLSIVEAMVGPRESRREIGLRKQSGKVSGVIMPRGIAGVRVELINIGRIIVGSHGR